jgi:hypothetical protein
MGIEEFGTNVSDALKEVPGDSPIPVTELAGDQGNGPKDITLTQWALVGNGEYMGVGPTKVALPPGIYCPFMTNKGVALKVIDIQVDELLELPDSLYAGIISEIDDFWTRGDKFKEYGFLHRRGYLLYGPQGGGKTCVVQQVINRIIKAGDVVMICAHPVALVEALSTFRRIEPGRRVVCVFEDLDAIIRDHGEDRILALLDGENQIDRVLNIGTTNYPERLDRRIVARPRRFDRVIKVGMPSDEVRRMYLIKKLSVSGEDLDLWVKESKGFSFAALAEMVISVKCLGNTLEKTVTILREISKAKSSSDEFETAKLGFGKKEDALS